ncbi:hypothetical protein DL96DRAFT_1635703 [Flagelloscypha sp. PMI_526]|nr:hypothetical protein DL96DRAFT_1635703 [Flagelloscypha sp. PMI_526]
MTTPTPLAGTVQARDVESIYNPPPAPRRKFQFNNPIRSGTVLYVASMGGTCILLVALSCFVFFSFVALGRLVIAYSGETPIQTHSGEYAAAVLAGFFFTLFSGGILALYVNCACWF